MKGKHIKRPSYSFHKRKPRRPKPFLLDPVNPFAKEIFLAVYAYFGRYQLFDCPEKIWAKLIDPAFLDLYKIPYNGEVKFLDFFFKELYRYHVLIRPSHYAAALARRFTWNHGKELNKDSIYTYKNDGLSKKSTKMVDDFFIEMEREYHFQQYLPKNNNPND